MARFQREAEVLASLNHPNIAHIYGVEKRALVMELVEGESPQGPMPFDEAWKIAAQIADALDYAHEKGIVHRDLKPANIKVTADGIVKLLDFGLAKAFNSPAAASANPENSPTLTLGATQLGVILGTAGYMAPEQAKGKAVDKRADIWSFGVVLYELLTGERLFHGEDVSDTLAQVLTKQPDLERVPFAARKLLRRCLDKDPKSRLRDISVAKELLVPEETAPARPRPGIGSRLGWIAAGVLFATTAALGWVAWRASRPVEHTLVRLDADLGSDISLVHPSAVGSTVILSPDGKRLVYSASVAGGQPRLFTRPLDQSKATELPGTEGAIDAFFSPDGQWIGFYSGTKLSKISVGGGAVVPLANLAVFGGASWGEDGNIVASEPLGRGLLLIPPAGGSETVLEAKSSAEAALAWPQILPGGQAVLFTSAKTGGSNSVEVLTFANHRRKTLARGGSSAHYLPISAHAGYLIYTTQATLFAVPLDLDKLETQGTPVPVLDDIAHSITPEGGQFAYSLSGTLVYRQGGAGTGQTLSTIQWVDTAGKTQPFLAEPGVYADPKVAPDGKRLALRVAGGNISVYDSQRGSNIRLTFDGALNANPVWSPDGKYVVFSSGTVGLRWTRGDGAGQPQPLVRSDSAQVPGSFTANGSRLAYFEAKGGRPQIWTVPIEENGGGLKAGTPEPFLKDQFIDIFPVFSPDGHWLAYQSSASGNYGIYVRAFPPPVSGQGGQWQVASGGGSSRLAPMWSRNGQELYYQSGDQIMALSYTVEGDAFVPGKLRVWIPKVGGTQWDIAPDGKRVAVLIPAGSTEASNGQDHTVVFLQNFWDYLQKQVPLP